MATECIIRRENVNAAVGIIGKPLRGLEKWKIHVWYRR